MFIFRQHDAKEIQKVGESTFAKITLIFNHKTFVMLTKNALNEDQMLPGVYRIKQILPTHNKSRETCFSSDLLFR